MPLEKSSLANYWEIEAQFNDHSYHLLPGAYAGPGRVSNSAALGGLKVIELGQLIAGPFAAKLLGEFGAEIIKIEPPDFGGPLREWRKLESGTSLWWHVQSRLI